MAGTVPKRRSKSAPASASRSSIGGNQTALSVFFIAWLLLASFVVSDTVLRNSYIEALSNVQTMENPPPEGGTPSGAVIRNTVLPPGFMDTRWWAIYAEELMRGDSARIRRNLQDNYPGEREVHWSGSITWLLALSAKMFHFFYGGVPDSLLVGMAAIWMPPTLLLFLSLVAGLLVARIWGWLPGAFFCFAYGSAFPLFEAFQAGGADHHGLVFFFTTLSVFYLAVAGWGAKLEKTDAGMPVKGASVEATDNFTRILQFVLSGIFGGLALWISAATFLPVLALCGAASLFSLVFPQSGGRLPTVGWKAWGSAGALTSLALYVLEYAPGHFGMRLEVNHPLYALSWFCLGWLLQLAAKAFRHGFQKQRSGNWILGMALLSGLVAPLFFSLWKPEFFLVGDAFLLSLHKLFITEFQTLPARLSAVEFPIRALVQFLMWPVVVLVTVVVAMVCGLLRGNPRRAVLCLMIPAIGMQALAFYQIRWNGAAVGLWLLIPALLLHFTIGSARSGTKVPKALVFVLTPLYLFALFVHPQAAWRAVWSHKEINRELPAEAAPTILLRDVAHRLVQATPHGAPVVLTGPTTSTEIAYYGGIRVIGTLYWENIHGLRRAAEVFQETDPDRLRQRFADLKITHLVVSSWDDFCEPYSRLLHRSKNLPGDTPQGVLERVIGGQIDPPDWLRPLYYPIPEVFGISEHQVSIFAFVPGQKRAEALAHRAHFHLEAGQDDSARVMVLAALAEDPAQPLALRIRDELFLK